ncbi:PREDICTED: GDSL esterase/lipase At4g16230-like isoform X2 [Nelumbo nucifera]|uniref:GDSL esterase/lipase At4g16230-like isoform X2 n=1 Tax=Nelumbo nucifera TaxID=4432 RepID=A0A1U7ZXH7_NELNU|nr:PREDICTED: GDSL esterase/lipase At4g16230-like isoform X2 [Nelumbo nucifera]
MMGILSNNRFIVEILTTIIRAIFFFWGSCSASDVPASFIFGDSLVDAGNNNYIFSLSRANYYPNGIDFGQPTGRYTNGRTMADIIGQELGMKTFAPPYLAPTTAGPVVLKGVNYASGGGGILGNTGQIFVGRIDMDAQLDNFENTRQEIISDIGVAAAMKLLSESLFSVAMGSNDFINNYLLPVLSIPERALRMYRLGARKIVVINVGPIGCIPNQREFHLSAGDDCSAFPNQLAKLFNDRLRHLVKEISSNLNGSIFVYADVYRIVGDIVENYTSYGFENADSACCNFAGRFGGLVPCGPLSRVCPDRSKYIFWDLFHPSDAANVLIAQRLMDGDCSDIFPINIRQLARARLP